MWGHDEFVVVAPKVDESSLDTLSEGTASFKFDHERVSVVAISLYGSVYYDWVTCAFSDFVQYKLYLIYIVVFQTIFLYVIF